MSDRQVVVHQHFFTPEAVRDIFFRLNDLGFDLLNIVLDINEYSFGLYTGSRAGNEHVLAESFIDIGKKLLILTYFYGPERVKDEKKYFLALPLDGIYRLEWY